MHLPTGLAVHLPSDRAMNIATGLAAQIAAGFALHIAVCLVFHLATDLAVHLATGLAVHLATSLEKWAVAHYSKKRLNLPDFSRQLQFFKQATAIHSTSHTMHTRRHHHTYHIKARTNAGSF